jgi:hypothetical protein
MKAGEASGRGRARRADAWGGAARDRATTQPASGPEAEVGSADSPRSKRGIATR